MKSKTIEFEELKNDYYQLASKYATLAFYVSNYLAAKRANSSQTREMELKLVTEMNKQFPGS